MRTIRIYHADASGEFRELFAHAVYLRQNMHLIGSSASGKEAELSVQEMHPDALLTSLALHKMDGMELIKRVNKMHQRPRIIVVSYLVGDFCIEEAARLGADYFMLKPCSLPVLLARIQELVLSPLSGMLSDPDSSVADLLSALGMHSSLNGYRYFAEAIQLARHIDGEYRMNKLYDLIAQANSVHVCAVERSMRHAIDSTWRFATTPMRDMLFPEPEKPGNGRFIARCVAYFNAQEAH